MFDGNEWRLAWFVTRSGAYATTHYSENLPDPERFLGRPLALEP
jgi:hypothetical protein